MPTRFASRCSSPTAKTTRRVKIGEAEQIVAAVRQNDTPVWYIRFEGEGHNLVRRENANYLMHAQILFLKQFLTPPPRTGRVWILRTLSHRWDAGGGKVWA